MSRWRHRKTWPAWAARGGGGGGGEERKGREKEEKKKRKGKEGRKRKKKREKKEKKKKKEKEEEEKKKVKKRKKKKEGKEKEGEGKWQRAGRRVDGLHGIRDLGAARCRAHSGGGVAWMDTKLLRRNCIGEHDPGGGLEERARFQGSGETLGSCVEPGFLMTTPKAATTPRAKRSAAARRSRVVSHLRQRRGDESGSGDETKTMATNVEGGEAELGPGGRRREGDAGARMPTTRLGGASPGETQVYVWRSGVGRNRRRSAGLRRWYWLNITELADMLAREGGGTGDGARHQHRRVDFAT